MKPSPKQRPAPIDAAGRCTRCRRPADTAERLDYNARAGARGLPEGCARCLERLTRVFEDGLGLDERHHLRHGEAVIPDAPDAPDAPRKPCRGCGGPVARDGPRCARCHARWRSDRGLPPVPPPVGPAAETPGDLRRMEEEWRRSRRVAGMVPNARRPLGWPPSRCGEAVRFAALNGIRIHHQRTELAPPGYDAREDERLREAARLRMQLLRKFNGPVAGYVAPSPQFPHGRAWPYLMHRSNPSGYRNALGSLSARQLQAFDLFYCAGLSLDEIAARTGRASKSSVSELIANARRRFMAAGMPDPMREREARGDVIPAPLPASG